MMDLVNVRNVENTCKFFIIKWYSFVGLKTNNNLVKDQFRRTEKVLQKCNKLIEDEIFLKTCLNNNLLSNFTNMYMCQRKCIFYETKKVPLRYYLLYLFRLQTQDLVVKYQVAKYR